MGNIGIYFILFSLIFISTTNIVATYANGNIILMPTNSYQKPESTVEEWFENLEEAKPVKTKLHFYLQDVLHGDNPTCYKVAESTITSTSSTAFGAFMVLDDPLTSGPEADSGVVGRAQGTVALAGLQEQVLHESVNIVFTEGKYNGSSIAILGRNPKLNKVRELSIVGGTGAFRMARGLVVTNTHSDDPVVGVYEYTLYVYHYEL